MSKNLQIQAVADYVEQMRQSDLIALWNTYCDDAGYSDDRVYESIEELGEILDGVELARAIYFGALDNWLDCVQLNAYGNVKSWHGLSDRSEAEELAAWVVDNDNAEFNAVLWLNNGESYNVTALTLGEACEEVEMNYDLTEDDLDGAELVLECERIVY